VGADFLARERVSCDKVEERFVLVSQPMNHVCTWTPAVTGSAPRSTPYPVTAFRSSSVPAVRAVPE
jgi:hypothetical protein